MRRAAATATRDAQLTASRMLRQVYLDIQRSAMARSTERGFNGWYTYGFWYAAITGTLAVSGLLVAKIWGPKLGEIDPPIKKGHRDLRTGEVHYFQPREQPLTTDDPSNSDNSESGAVSR